MVQYFTLRKLIGNVKLKRKADHWHTPDLVLAMFCPDRQLINEYKWISQTTHLPPGSVDNNETRRDEEFIFTATTSRREII